MMTTNLGDLSRAFLLRRQTSTVKADLNQLSAELGSGRLSDLQSRLDGNFGALAGVEHGLKLNAGYAASNRDAGQFAAAQQLALTGVLDITTRAGADYLNVASTGETTQRNTIYAQAADQLDQLLARLNTSFGDRSLFAGVATDAPAIADAATLLAGLSTALSGQTTAAGVQAAADAWFDTPGGGFETTVYQGATTDLAPFDIGENAQVALTTRADAQPLREVLKQVAVTALMGQGLLAGNVAEQKRLLADAGAGLMNSADEVTALKAGIGYDEERIDTARLRSDSQAAALRMAQNALVQADPFETALRLSEVEAQLETIYTLTARLSGLSLVSVLR
ncbi:hypothetical protein AB0T83_11100 [Fluviibacterium sp. DFM31]|uniref:Flagellin n=1 Tax=Meridianimarinicoccus marinus TaxID=3231483 RepID=A0ABV3L8G6_9RHOB